MDNLNKRTITEYYFMVFLIVIVVVLFIYKHTSERVCWCPDANKLDSGLTQLSDTFQDSFFEIMRAIWEDYLSEVFFFFVVISR